MTIQTIAFDFGNVLGFFDHRRAARRLAEHVPAPEHVIYARLLDEEIEDAYESGQIGSAEFLQGLRDTFAVACSDEVLGDAYSDIFWPNTEVCQLIPRLKPRYRLLLGSNTTELHARRFQREFAETLRHFDAAVLSYAIQVRKPKAGFFEHCRRQAGHAAEECLFIDDLPANIAGARAAGWHGIVYSGYDKLCAELENLGIRV